MSWRGREAPRLVEQAGTVVSLTFSEVMRLHFNLFNDIHTEDDEGQEFEDMTEARELALTEARMMAAESVKRGHLNLSHFLQVTDTDGTEVFRVTFGDAVVVIP